MPLFNDSEMRTSPHAGRRRRFDLGSVRPADLYDAWVFAAADATLALAAWLGAPSAAKRDAHAAYRAALDREEHAADLLAYRLRGAVPARTQTA
jgi:hypothetical protein